MNQKKLTIKDKPQIAFILPPLDRSALYGEIYPITKFILYTLGRKDLGKLDKQGFINHYDGPDNPLGKIYDVNQAKKLVSGLKKLRHEIHYVPTRFLPRLSFFKFAEFLERFLDNNFGFLIYVEGYKPKK